MRTLKILFVLCITFGFINPDIVPKGWTKSGNNHVSYKVGVDNQISQHGHKSVSIESIDEKHTGFCTLTQICSEKNFKGKRVKMTGYIKTQGTIDTAQMWVRVDNLDKKIFADFDNMDDRPLIGTKDWIKREIVFDVPDSRCVILYGFFLHGVGKIWFDNISFEIVNASISTTGKGQIYGGG
jgi:hypothetical protein